MRVYEIRGDSEGELVLSWLFYEEKTKNFRIEIPFDGDEWTTPLLLSSFVKKGIYTVDAYWSKVWVQQRIVPIDRQNIAQILKDNGLTEYDEYQLLILANGRCCQDDYYLREIRWDQLPEEIQLRFEKNSSQ